MTPDDLRQRIKDAQARQSKGDAAEKVSKTGRGDSVAFRAATDLVAGVAVGAFMGYWIDRWIGTKPFAMILLLFLGFVAGFMNIYRSQMAPSKPPTDANQKTDNKGS